jgi:hypothetical protein
MYGFLMHTYLGKHQLERKNGDRMIKFRSLRCERNRFSFMFKNGLDLILKGKYVAGHI